MLAQVHSFALQGIEPIACERRTSPKVCIVSKLSRFCGGFSLVELLVVLALSAVLLGLLFPVLLNIREDATSIKCAGQLKGLGQTIELYRNDHDGHYPKALAAAPVTHTPQDSVLPQGLVPLPKALSGYLTPESGLYRCPGDEHQVLERILANGWATATSYVYWGYGAEFHSHHSDQSTQAFLRENGLMHDFIGTDSYTPEPLHKPENKLFPDISVQAIPAG